MMDYQKLIEHLKHMQIDIKDAPALTEAIYIISDYEKATAQTSEISSGTRKRRWRSDARLDCTPVLCAAREPYRGTRTVTGAERR